MWNFRGSLATSAARSSLGNPNPIDVSSGEIETNTILPTRNLTWSRIRCSSLRGSEPATRRTSSAVTTPGHLLVDVGQAAPRSRRERTPYRTRSPPRSRRHEPTTHPRHGKTPAGRARISRHTGTTSPGRAHDRDHPPDGRLDRRAAHAPRRGGLPRGRAGPAGLRTHGRP